MIYWKPSLNFLFELKLFTYGTQWSLDIDECTCPLSISLMHWCFKNCFSYELMITCYLVSKCGHSICGSCHSRQDEQVATRCPVCNTTLLCYILNIAFRNAERALNCTCKYCKSSPIAEDILTHQKGCGEIPVQCNTCPEKIVRNQLSLRLCPNETSNCACGARVRRVEMHRHEHSSVLAFPLLVPQHVD